MVSFLDLPAELRQQILALAISTPKQAPSSPVESQDRVRLRDDWDIWVLADPPEPAVLPFMLTCKTLRDDVLTRHFQDSAPYELDVMFLPGFGLWLTWTCCPTRKQFNLATLRVVFRIFQAQNQMPGDDLTGESVFTRRFAAISCSFNSGSQFPNPPPAAWNFYRLLVSLLSLGPAGLISRAEHWARRGTLLWSPPLCTVHRLALVTETQPRVFTRWELLRHQLVHPAQLQMGVRSNPDVPYGSMGDSTMFPGPPAGSGYQWSGPGSTNFNTQGAPYGDANKLGLWLANALWALLKFGRLSRGFGLIVYEGIVESIEFSVDGEVRARYDMRALLARLPHTPMRAEDMEALLKWRDWFDSWSAFREDIGELPVLPPRPTLSFPRFLPRTHGGPFDDT